MMSSKLTKAQAIALAASGWWKGLPAADIVMFQLFEDKLCMDFSAFHKAVEATLGRVVWTHEFGGVGWQQLQEEFLGDRSAPTWEQIVELIPIKKRMILIVEP